MKSQLINGDSISILPNFDSSSVHLILSDIPYGIGYASWDVLHANTNSTYGGNSQAQLSAGNIFKRRGKPLNGWSSADKKIPLEYQQWCSSWAHNWHRILKSGGSCFVFAGRRLAHRCICALEEAGFTFKDQLAWLKGAAPQRAQRLSVIYDRRNDAENSKKWAGWRVANLRPLYEPILWFQKPYKVGATLADNVLANGLGAWNEQALHTYNTLSGNLATTANIIKVNSDNCDHGSHPAQKPLSLMKLLIELVTLEGHTVLDPFMGSGTTCLAAKALKRNYIGIEADFDNFKIAEYRVDHLDRNMLPGKLC